MNYLKYYPELKYNNKGTMKNNEINYGYLDFITFKNKLIVVHIVKGRSTKNKN